MGLKNDRWIREQAEAGMITPYAAQKVSRIDGQAVLSYGVESYGYTMQLADEWQIVDPRLSPAKLATHIVDPKDAATLAAILIPVQAPTLVMPPRSVALARSLEYWRIPPDVACVVVGKSSLARCSLIVNVTPLEPGWEGHVTIELTNPAPYSIIVYAFEGAAQVLFLGGEEAAEGGYVENGGRYQGQRGITLPR